MIRMRKETVYWISGIAVALVGVASVRLIAPELVGVMSKVTIILGYVLSLTGIVIIARAAKA